MPQELGAAIDSDLYSLHTDCLEEEGDCTEKRPDTDGYDGYKKETLTSMIRRAAKAAVSRLCAECGETEEEIPEIAYELVEKRCTAISSESL